MDTEKTNQAEVAQQNTAAETQPEKEETAKRSDRQKQKNKEAGGKTLLRVIISIVVIVVGIFLILFFVAKAAKYDSIGSMLNDMSIDLGLMWERITR